MTSSRLELIAMLEKELDILEKGGYASPAGAARQPSKIFEDSLACINHWLVPGHDPNVCNGCVLLEFVPPEKREAKHACRYIPLNARGDTVESLSGLQDSSRLEEAVRGWLASTIEKLRRQTDRQGPEIDY